MHFSPDKDTSMRNPKLKSLRGPSPSTLLTFTNYSQNYSLARSVVGHVLKNRPDKYASRKCGSDRSR